VPYRGLQWHRGREELRVVRVAPQPSNIFQPKVGQRSKALPQILPLSYPRCHDVSLRPGDEGHHCWRWLSGPLGNFLEEPPCFKRPKGGLTCVTFARDIRCIRPFCCQGTGASSCQFGLRSDYRGHLLPRICGGTLSRKSDEGIRRRDNFLGRLGRQISLNATTIM